MSVAPLEPVKNAPAAYRADNTVTVEFLSPMLVGARCASRGASMFGVPAMNSMACGNGDTITMPNPCMTLTSGWYARLLCHELAHANGWSRDHKGGSFLPDQWAGVDSDNVPLTEATLNQLAAAGEIKPASQSPQAIALASARESEKPAPKARLLFASAKAEASSGLTLASLSDTPIHDADSAQRPIRSAFKAGPWKDEIRPKSNKHLAGLAAPAAAVPSPLSTVEAVPGATKGTKLRTRMAAPQLNTRSGADDQLATATAPAERPAVTPASAAPTERKVPASVAALSTARIPMVGYTQRYSTSQPYIAAGLSTPAHMLP